MSDMTKLARAFLAIEPDAFKTNPLTARVHVDKLAGVVEEGEARIGELLADLSESRRLLDEANRHSDGLQKAITKSGEHYDRLFEKYKELQKIVKDARAQKPMVQCYSTAHCAWLDCTKTDCTNIKRTVYASPVPAQPASKPLFQVAVVDGCVESFATHGSLPDGQYDLYSAVKVPAQPAAAITRGVEIARQFQFAPFSDDDIARLEPKMNALGATLKCEQPSAVSNAPCSICGYNGHGYYQPETHPCVKQPAAVPEAVAKDAAPSCFTCIHCDKDDEDYPCRSCRMMSHWSSAALLSAADAEVKK